MARGRRRFWSGLIAFAVGSAAAGGLVASGRWRLVATNGLGFESLQVMRGTVWVILPPAGQAAPGGWPTLTVQDCLPRGLTLRLESGGPFVMELTWRGWKDGRRPADLWVAPPQSWKAFGVVSVQGGFGARRSFLFAPLPAVTLWVVLGAATGAWGWWAGRRSLRRGLCPTCGYERAGVPAAAPCPECGRPQAPAGLSPASPASGPAGRSGAC